MDVFKTKGFQRFARRQRIDDDALCEAVERAERGLMDADLGGGVIKQRIARSGQGRSGGFRTIILYRIGNRAIFVDGFAKSDQDNIDGDDLERFRDLALEFFLYESAQIKKLVKSGAWIRVMCNGS